MTMNLANSVVPVAGETIQLRTSSDKQVHRVYVIDGTAGIGYWPLQYKERGLYDALNVGQYDANLKSANNQVPSPSKSQKGNHSHTDTIMGPGRWSQYDEVLCHHSQLPRKSQSVRMNTDFQKACYV
jgi:hypothetical protein